MRRGELGRNGVGWGDVLLHGYRIFTARIAGHLALAGLLFCGLTGTAWAHPQLDEGKRLFAELELEGSLGAFQSAVDSGELTREELIELLAERALVLHALHRREELISDFVWLSALAPERILDMRAPPALVATWISVRDQGRGVLGVSLAHESSASGLKLRAEFTGTVPEGVRTRIGVRARGAEWDVVDDSERTWPATQRGELEVFAEALGFRDVVLATDGAREAPKSILVDPLPYGSQVDAEERRRRKKRWIVSGAAVLAVAGVAVGAYFIARNASRDDGPLPSEVTPVVMF